eukprot:Hpha_TRINITY_DN33044_c0_g1::TRINITY_DN33044_c0_g1_i1::g.158643::m.158643
MVGAVPLWVAAAVVCVTILGKAGDCMGPVFVHDHPLALLTLNANDLHCALTAHALDLVSWFTVATARRLAEDPLFYYIGWRYKDDARAWLMHRAPDAAAAVRRAEGLLCRGAAVAVFVDPGMVVCCLAGAARMQPVYFAVVNILGTLARLALIRAVALAFPEQIQWALGVLHEYQHAAVAVVVAATTFGVWKMARWRASPTPPDG